MNKSRFQIIIPTIGGREKYLYWTLRTCLEQDYPNFDILVSNNGGSPDIRRVVDSFKDGRIKYIETRSVLAMAAHWDFAVAHSDGQIITIIGDDDALMPNSLTIVNDIFVRNQTIDCVTHFPGQYYWPDFHDPACRNRYRFRQGSGALEIIDTKSVLQDVSEFRSWYGNLPFLYHGFVKRDVLARIIRAQGKLFKRTSPDIYSDVVLAITMERYARFDGCLTFGGQGAKSNGANFCLNNELGKQFGENLPDYLKPKYYLGNIQIQIYEIVEKAREEFGCRKKLKMAWLRFAKQSIVEALLTPAHRENALQGLKRIANNDFPVIKRMIVVALISIVELSWVRQIATKALIRRQQSLMSHLDNASDMCGADNIYDLVKFIAAAKKGGNETSL